MVPLEDGVNLEALVDDCDRRFFLFKNCHRRFSIGGFLNRDLQTGSPPNRKLDEDGGSKFGTILKMNRGLDEREWILLRSNKVGQNRGLHWSNKVCDEIRYNILLPHDPEFLIRDS
ncbi:hypothetical protein LXL04_025051 [Taraxacum kok-saghyz]